MENQDKNQTTEQVEKQIEGQESKELSTEEKLKIILHGVNKEGKTLKQVSEELGYKDGDGASKILKRADYVRRGKKYVHKSELEKENKGKDSSIKDKNASIEDVLNQLKSISERLDRLENKDNSGMVVSNKEMNYKGTSIRVDEQTLAAFNDVCKTYSNVDKSYLTTLAFQEFIDKYGK